MGRGIEKKLTVAGIKSFQKKAAEGSLTYGSKLADGGGLLLVVNRGGSVSWRYRYDLGGRERTYSLGTFPEISLEAARTKLHELRQTVAAGKDPVQEKVIQKQREAAATEDTFANITEQWLKVRRQEWKDSHYTRSKRALDRDVLPHLGKLPIAAITPAMVTSVITKITERGVRDTAQKILLNIEWIFRYAQSKGLIRDNPATPAVEAIPRRQRVKHHPALLELPALLSVLKKAETASIRPDIKLANLLLAYTAVRIANAVGAEWEEFDLDADQPTWRIPSRKMKVTDSDHAIPLHGRIVSELKKWRAVTSSKGFLFAAATKRGHISAEGLEKVYREQLGLRDKHTPHGWRSSFATLARENQHSRDVVEIALHHVHDNDVVLAYDRGERKEDKLLLFQWWAQQLDRAFH